MEFRIAQINDDKRGVLTGAFVFSPPPHLPEVVRVLVERFGAENTKLGPHGWAVDSRGLRPRVIEKRGVELWLCFGAEVSFHVLPNTPVRVAIMDSDIEGTEIWPPIPRGKAPPADIPEDDAPWPDPAKTEPAKAEPAKTEPARAEPAKMEPAEAAPVNVAPVAEEKKPAGEDATIIVAPPKVVGPPPRPPPPPPVTPKRGSPLALIAMVLLLLGAAGGAAWWFLRPPPVPPQQDAATPPPVVAADCAGAADVMSGRCTPEKMIALPPGEQTRLAEALLALGERRAGDMAISLLSAAASRHNHPPANYALGRLYDPATFKPGGPLSAANAARALDLFAKAAEAGLADARTAREALVARLKQEAAGSDAAAAERARAALAAAGIP
ncbi:MAG: hypothetical protein IT555_15870 [Acetobacteraceae bacterium]|nr:hypothetical protein [Acetobacteraceae bacterium]